MTPDELALVDSLKPVPEIKALATIAALQHYQTKKITWESLLDCANAVEFLTNYFVNTEQRRRRSEPVSSEDVPRVLVDLLAAAQCLGIYLDQKPSTPDASWMADRIQEMKDKRLISPEAWPKMG